MAVAAIIGAALQYPVAPKKALWIDGLDVLKEPASYARYGVPIETVQVDEQGAGAVSSMSFTIEDTALAITVSDGQRVAFQDLLRDRPLFRGWVDGVEIAGMEGDIGRLITVKCVGQESIIDWAVLPADIPVAAGADTNATIQALCSVSVATGELRALAPTAGPWTSSRALPISQLNTSWVVAAGAGFTLSAGTTLREAIRAVQGASSYNTLYTNSGVTRLVTVDMYFGLRVYENDTGGISTTDYTSPPMNDNTALLGNYQGEPTTYGAQAAEYRAVLVKGTGVTAYVGDGSGKQGPTAVLIDATITTQAGAQSAGLAFLAQYVSLAHGTVTWRDMTPTYDTHPGVQLTITNSRIGVNAPFIIGSISKTFRESGREDWVVNYGGVAPSASKLMRRLTRSTLS